MIMRASETRFDDRRAQLRAQFAGGNAVLDGQQGVGHRFRGRVAAQAAGADVSKSTWYEDYRATKEAEHKAQIDRYRIALGQIANMPDRFPFSTEAANEAVKLAKDALSEEKP